MQQEEFYIGWQAETPPAFARIVRRCILALLLLIPVTAVLVALFQHGFSNGTFEFGKTTVLEGTFHPDPVPFLAIETGQNAAGDPVFQQILLVDKGKFGFSRPDLNGQQLKVFGSLIYDEGKTALEVESVQAVTTEHRISSIPGLFLGNALLRGEIADPKCLLGVMNPGQGKPHRDCAARCIAGGIPPVLKVGNAEGESEYYLLAGPQGEPLNHQILEYVGDGVQICGRLEQRGDWLILYADPASIRQVNKGALNPGVMCN